MLNYPPGSTSKSLIVQVVDDTGLAVTGLAAATFPSTSYQIAGPNAAVAFPALSDLALITTAWSAGGLKELSGGYYRLDAPDAVFTAAGKVRVYAEASGKHLLMETINVEYLQSDVRQLLGTAWLTPGTAGTPDVNAKLVGGATQTARDLGLALPAVAPNTNGGLPILSSSGTTLGYTISTLTTYTGNTPQTGNSFALLTGTGAVTFASLTVTGTATLNITGNVTGSVGSVSANVNAVLANTAHGGTSATLRLGGSTSTPAFYVTNSVGDATRFDSTSGSGLAMNGGTAGLYLNGTGSGAAGLWLTAQGDNCNALYANVTGTGAASATIWIESSSTDALHVTSNATGYDINLAGSGTIHGSLTGSAGSVTAGVTVTTNNDKTGYSLTQSFPANFAALGISAAGNARADVRFVNAIQVQGAGTAGNPWRPV